MADSIYLNLLKNNHNRELYLKLELINPVEPEWLNPDGETTVTCTYSSGSVTFTLTDFNSGNSYRSYAVETGDLVRAYPVVNNVQNSPFNQYSFPITATSLSSTDFTVTVDASNSGFGSADFADPILVDRFYFIEKEVSGKIVTGSINIDAQNTARRTISLTFSVDVLGENASLKIQDFLNKRIKIYIGMKNLLNEDFNQIENNGLPPDLNNIVWFKMGVFNLTDINMEHSLDSISISISAQDKSALMDGNAGGVFGESPPTQYYDQDTAVSYYDMINDFLVNYSGQQANKINVNFDQQEYSNFYSSIISYNSGITTTFSLLNYNTFTTTGSPGTSIEGGLIVPNGMSLRSNFYWDDNNKYISNGITFYYPAGYSVATKGLTLAGYTSIFSSGVTAGNIWRDLKPIQFATATTGNLYYQDQPLQFNANDTVLSAVQNITQQLPGQYQFYFDYNGDFQLEQKPLTADILAYVDPLTTLKPTSYMYTTAVLDDTFSSFFSDSAVVNSYSHNTRYAGLKNDLSIYSLNGIAYAPGISSGYDVLGNGTTYVRINNEVLYHAVITSLPPALKTFGFTLGYGVTGVTYGHPYQQFIIDKTTKNPATNINLGLGILKDYQPELQARFEFKPIVGITEWSFAFNNLVAGNTVYIGKTNNYYKLTAAFDKNDWANPITDYPINTSATYKGAKFLGLYNPYYGIYKKLQSTDSGVVPVTYGTTTFYYTTTSIYGPTTYHFGIYRSKNTGNPSIDFDITKPLGDYTSWLYWFDVLDEKIDFWSSSSGYTSGNYVLYNEKTYKALSVISSGGTNPTSYVSTASSGWTVARQGYGLYDISIDRQGVRKIRLDDETVNLNFKKSADRYTGIPQIYLVKESLAYNLEEFNGRLNYLLQNLDSQGVTTAYLLLTNSGVDYAASDPFNKILPVDYAQAVDGFTKMKDLMFQYTTLEDNVSLSALPVYAFDVDNKVNIKDSQLNVDNNYYVRSISLPLDNTGMMQLEGIKITPLFMGSGLNNPNTIEVASFTTTAAPSTTVKKYFITDSQNNTLNVFNSTNTGPEKSTILNTGTAGDILKTTYYKDTSEVNKLFLLSSNMYLTTYNIDTAAVSSTKNLSTSLSGSYKSLDFYKVSNTKMYILCISQTGTNDSKILVMNPNTLAINTAETRTIAYADLPLGKGNLASLTYESSSGKYYIYAYKSNPAVYVFTDNNTTKTFDLVYSGPITNYKPQISGVKSTNKTKIEYSSDLSPNAFYILTDNNILRIRDIYDSFTGTTVTYTQFDLSGSGTVINSADRTVAINNYTSVPGASNDFRSFFTTTAISEIVNGTIYAPTTATTYPNGSTITYDFSASAFGGFQVTSTAIAGLTVGILSNSAAGPTVGFLYNQNVSLLFFQPILSSGFSVYSRVTRDNNEVAGNFIGAEDIFISSTDGVYIVAGTNIYLLSDFYLANSSAQTIFI